MNMNMKEIHLVPLNDTGNFFYTTDIQVAAILKVVGYKLVSIDKPKEQGTFIFSREKGLEDVVEAFLNGHIENVQPLAVLNELRALKSRLRAM
jgi:hypothetical protein